MHIDNEDVFGSQRNPLLPQPSPPLQPLPHMLPPQPTPPLPTPPQLSTPSPPPLPTLLLPPPPTPPQQAIPSRRDPAWNVSGHRYSNARRPSNAGQSDNKWCSTGRHHRPPINFIENGRTFQTCNDCRAAQRRNRANQRATNANAQVLQQLEQQEAPPQNPSPPNNPALQPHPPPPSPVPPPQQLDPLLNPAISAEDQNYLEQVRTKWSTIQLESCDGCEREWFDLGVQQVEAGDNLCKDCQKQRPQFHKNNNLYPGPGCPDLPSLTQIEEMLISPVHALIQVGF